MKAIFYRINIFLSIILLVSACDPPIPNPLYHSDLVYTLSDTSGFVKLGDTVTIQMQIPNPIITKTGEVIAFSSIKTARIGFASFKIGDSISCKKGAFYLITDKGFEFTCRNIPVDIQTGLWQVKFVPKDTGWYIFDCGQNGDYITIKNNGDDITVGVKYTFKGKDVSNELYKQYPCIKQELELTKQLEIGNYTFKVIP